jgi:hypothetical protein
VVDSSNNKEWKLTRIDLEVLAALSAYHGARILSAQNFEFFRRTGDRACLRDSIGYAVEALGRWQRIVELTDGVYYEHMVFNEPPNQIGHWKDLVPLLAHDVGRLKEIDRLYLKYRESPRDAQSLKAAYPWYTQTLTWGEKEGVLSRWVGEIVPAVPLDYPFYEQRGREHVVQAPELVIQELFANGAIPRLGHVPVRFADGDREVPIRASVIGQRRDVQVVLRCAVPGRDEKYRSIEMREHGDNVYLGLVPPMAPGSKLHYYIEAKDRNGISAFSHGTGKSPHILFLGYRGEKPSITHQHVCECCTGDDLSIRVGVHTSSPLLYVRLHYRHLIQSEDWNIVDMENVGGVDYEAVIMGEYITSRWDIMYAIEAVDECGNGTFYPNLDIRQPFVVVTAKSA